MATSTILSIAILVFSVLLFVFHFYLVFVQKSLEKKLQDKKLAQQKREEDEKKLQVISQMLLEDKQLSNYFNEQIKKYEQTPTLTKELK